MYKELKINYEDLGMFNFENLCDACNSYNRSLKDRKNRGVAVSERGADRKVIILYKTEADIFHLGAYFSRKLLLSASDFGYRQYFEPTAEIRKR